MNHSTRKFNTILIPIFIFLLHIPFVFAKSKFPENHNVYTTVSKVNLSGVAKNISTELYENLQLSNLGLSEDAYNYAVQGYEYLRNEGKLNNDQILTIVDFSLPSSAKRL
ncbi:MAG: hypothetical protein ABIP35_10460, partial [Ginsengibacter sp.]